MKSGIGIACLVGVVGLACSMPPSEDGGGRAKDDAIVGKVTEPIQIGTDSYTHADAGGHYVCAVRQDGRLLCWGANWFGQVGVGSQLNDQPSPMLIGAATWTTVSTGLQHSCGVQT